MLDQLSHVKVVNKVDLRGAYNLMYIWKGDEWKIVFQTPYGHFEYVVMPFRLINAFAIFQHLMNDVSHEYLVDFIVCYINDILIFSKNMEEHGWHVQLVLDKFKEVHYKKSCIM